MPAAYKPQPAHATLERRQGWDPDYTGPERRRGVHTRPLTEADMRGRDNRLRALEASNNLLTEQMAQMTVAMSGAVAAGIRQALTDPALLTAVFDAAVVQSRKGIYAQAGKWVFSRWTGIAVIVYMLSSYLGWPATLKVLWGLVTKP